MNMRLPGQHVQHILRHAIANMQESVLPCTDVDKGRLHAGQDILHLPFIDIADEVGMRRALNFEHLQLSLSLDGQARLLRHSVDIDGLQKKHLLCLTISNVNPSRDQ